MKLWSRIAGRSVVELVRIACFLALAGLSALAISVIWPRPLPVIFAMSVGQAIGIAAFGCYGLAVLLDIGRQHRERAMKSAAPTGDAPVSTSSPPPSER